MKLLTGGPSLDERLAELVTIYDNVAFAVAWAGTGTQTYNALLSHRSKVQYGIIGTQFYQTHPNVLHDFTGSDAVRFIVQPQGVFHPKVYAFWNSDTWELFVGSANLTSGGMGDNAELVLHAVSSSDDPQLPADLLGQIHGYWDTAVRMTRAKSEEYRAAWQSKREPLRQVKSPPVKRRRRPKADADIEIMQWPWATFVKEVRADRNGFYEERRALLRDVSKAFKSQESLVRMDIETRKMIAGLESKRSDHWGYFGSMMGAGYFKHIIIDVIHGLSEGLDAIPLEGPVAESMYQAYIDAFREAMPEVKDGIGTATRLLAMKRPDTFVCLDNANKSRLCKAFGIVAHGMDYQRYWDEILTRIHDCVWWNEPIPKNTQERFIWRARAALLDALYYDPK